MGVINNTSNTSIRFIAAYYPEGSNNHRMKLFRRDTRKLFQSNKPLFVIGDFNAQHRAWNCVKANKAGNVCTELPEIGRGKLSTLDLTVSNNRFTLSVPKVIHDLSSDHLPVNFAIDIEIPFNPTVHQWRYYNRADWTFYIDSSMQRLVCRIV